MRNMDELSLLNLANNILGGLKIPSSLIEVGRASFTGSVMNFVSRGEKQMSDFLEDMTPGTLGQICGLALCVAEEDGYRIVPFKTFCPTFQVDRQVGKRVLELYAARVLAAAIWEIIATERQITNGSVFSKTFSIQYSHSEDMGVDYEPSEKMFEFVMSKRIDRGPRRRHS